MIRNLLLFTSVFLSSCTFIVNEKALPPGEGNELRIIERITDQSFSIGQDTLALQSKNWNVASITNNVPHGTSLGLLYSSFGSSTANIESVLTNIAPQYLRVHLINGPGIRNRQSGPNEIGYGFNKATFEAAVKARSQKILSYVTNSTRTLKALSDSHPGTIFLISPELEHDLSITSYRVLADTVLAAWPTVQLVNSPDGGVTPERYRRAWVERHGTNPQSDADITSLDGAEATDSDVLGYLARAPHAKVKFIWTRLYNCRKDAAPFEFPLTRVTCPDGNEVKEHVHIIDVPATPTREPAVCKKIVPFSAPWIWKPLSEHGPDPDPRADKPVAITKYTSHVLSLLDQNGNVAGTLGYYGPYTPLKLQRAYSGFRGGSAVHGYQFEEQALARAGNRYLYLYPGTGTECAGPILAGRRNGSYRESI